MLKEVRLTMIDLEKDAKALMKSKHKDYKFDEYQNASKETAIYPHNVKVLYPALGLAGEAGEVANKIKKVVRDGVGNMPNDWKEQVGAEIGDVLWYCAALASDLNLSLAECAMKNRNKLQSRMKRGKIKGTGDRR